MVGVQVGTLPQWLTLFSILVVGLPLIRGARGTAVQNLTAENRELEREVKTRDLELSQVKTELAAALATRDLAPIQTALLEALGHHEDRAAERAEKVLIVLDLIAQRLGPNHVADH